MRKISSPGIEAGQRESEPPTGPMAIVFTDIQDSTALWEDTPIAMREAIAVHNSVIRRITGLHSGYEVKSIGDAFMITFRLAKAALSWSLDIQTELLGAPWPDAILRSPSGKQVRDKNSQLISQGLSVRIGVHWGEPICEMNNITGRMDYLGPVVHRAARMVDLADGGQIITSRAFLDQLVLQRAQATELKVEPQPGLRFSTEEDANTSTTVRSSSPRRQQLFAMRDIGKQELKGISSPLHLYAIVPGSLSERLTRGLPGQPSVQYPTSGLWECLDFASNGLSPKSSEQNVLPV